MCEDLETYLTAWSLQCDGAPFETATSWLQPVLSRQGPAMLKVLKPASDEQNAAALLRYYDGVGAVRLFAADDKALVMERASGAHSLSVMATTGEDAAAAEILADTLVALHKARHRAPPASLEPLSERFSSLFAQEAKAPLLARAAGVARALLSTERDILPLHGDLHHDNVLDGGRRGWLAIDPKGVFGERAYEVANLLRNPWPYSGLVLDRDRMNRLAAFYAKRLGLERKRVLAYAFAHAGLSACWDMDDRLDPGFSLACAEILAPMVEA